MAQLSTLGHIRTTHFMNRLTRAWKAGVKGYREGVVPDRPTPAEYQCGGHAIHCPQCKGERFMMSPPSMFSWAVVLMCDKCGFIQRYGKTPEIRVA